MCRIPFTIQYTDAEGDVLQAAQGRYRLASSNDSWNIFQVNPSDPRTPDIIPLGTYSLQVRIQDTSSTWSNWFSSEFTVSENCHGCVAIPTANAGSNFVHQMNPVSAGATNTGTLNGGMSEHNATSFSSILWEVVEAPNGLDNGLGTYIYIHNPDLLVTTMGVTNNSVAVGLWRLRLTVMNDCGEVASDVVQITLQQETPNVGPTANAKADVSTTRSKVLLDGRDSYDLDGTIVSYKWRHLNGPPATFDDDDQEQTYANLTLNGTYQFELTVTDNDGDTGSDIIQVLKKENIGSGSCNCDPILACCKPCTTGAGFEPGPPCT